VFDRGQRQAQVGGILMTDAELQALSALSMAESIHHMVEAMAQQSSNEYVVHYGGPYGYDYYTSELLTEMQKRKR